MLVEFADGRRGGTVIQASEIDLPGLSAGDPAAFRPVYERFSPDVKRFLLGLGLPLVHQDLEDALQETFLRLLRGASRIDPQRPLGPFVLGIARNVAIDLCRRQGRLRPAPDEPDGLPSETSVSDEVLRGERRRLIESALAAMDPEPRVLIALRHVNGLKMKELEACLSCSAPTARLRLRQAVTLFAQELRRLGVVPKESCR